MVGVDDDGGKEESTWRQLNRSCRIGRLAGRLGQGDGGEMGGRVHNQVCYKFGSK